MTNIPLNILDNYAKSLTSKQVKMLYENKCQKKFKKPLYENLKYQSDNNYKIYLDTYTLNEANSSIDKTLLRYVNKYNLQYNVVNEGVYLYTALPENYLSLLENLLQDGFNKNSLKNNVNTKFAKHYLNKK